MGAERPEPSRDGRRAKLEILLYGLAGGVLIAVLELVERRYFLAGGSFELYGGAIALLFAGLGIWFGASLRRTRKAGADHEGGVADAEPFAPDAERAAELGVTPRELEILGTLAAGLSNREIAETLFVSENTVKTHVKRLFDKLGAKRRTQAVRIGRSHGLLP